MNIRVLFVLLLIGVLLAFTPRFRRVGLVMCVAIAVLLLFITIREAEHPEQDSRPATVQASSSSASIASKPRAQLVGIELAGRGSPWYLRGSVENLSDIPIRSLSLNIERYDCPTSSTPQSECSLLWQGLHVVRTSIAARGKNKIDESFYSHVAVPLQNGVIRDQIRITEVE